MGEQEKPNYIFAQFRIDVAKRLLFEADQIVKLTPKAFDTLLVLVENRGSVLSKEELMRLVWPDQFVEENNLAQNIHSVRKLIGDGADGVRYIETIPKRGYRFVGEVTVIDGPRASDAGEQAVKFLTRAAETVTHGSDSGPSSNVATRPERALTSIIPKTQYVVSTNGVNIAYQVVGNGPLDLVFVMGWVSHLEYFW